MKGRSSSKLKDRNRPKQTFIYGRTRFPRYTRKIQRTKLGRKTLLALSSSSFNFLSFFLNPLPYCPPPPFIATFSHPPIVWLLVEFWDTCPIKILLCHFLIMKKDFWGVFSLFRPII